VKGLSGFSDLDLISETRKGNNEAFSILISRYQDQVAKTIIGMLGDCMEADDVGQETFIRFYRSIDKFRGESALATYLTRIAINLSLNELAKRKKEQSIFSGRKEYEREIGEPDPVDEPEKGEIREAVQKAIDKLSPKHKAVVVLRLIDGFSTRETAEILKLPIGTVLSRLARAQESLKDILGNYIQ